MSDASTTGSAERKCGCSGERMIRVSEGVMCLPLSVVNTYLIGARNAGNREWVLVDCGLPLSGEKIARAAAQLFGPFSRPAAIVLTHGHFDHTGAVSYLAELWQVPVYAHPLELPYLTGLSSYPPPDPTTGGGAMSLLSPLYPRGPIDISDYLEILPEDGSVPGLPGWHWIFTPGHSPGHISLFRNVDRTLIAGDAFVTTRQESLIWALTKREEINGPPKYFTPDWQTARQSVEALSELEPESIGTGHGRPMAGQAMREELRALATNFELFAMPARGRYVNCAAVTDETGVVQLPPADFRMYLTGGSMLMAAGVVLGALTARFRHN
jgi:glyoxylase-like metal-dependent hydrolase (beta-lactamase superfamily II)